MYDLLNTLFILCMSCISITHFYVNDSYVKNALLGYFFIDGYVNRNKTDIFIHHCLFAFLTYYIQPREFFYKYLLFEWTTLFLICYRDWKWKTKELFAISWFALRIVYNPIITYNIIIDQYHSKYIYFLCSNVMYALFFHWTCKILHRKINTVYGFSSMMLYLFPTLFMLYNDTMTFEKYIGVYYQSLISFYFHVIREKKQDHYLNYKIAKALDTSGITYFASRYIMPNQYYQVLLSLSNVFIKYFFVNSEFHSIILFLTICKMLYLHNETILFVIPGSYIMYNNIVHNQFSLFEKYAWHFCVSISLAYTLMN